MSLIDCTLSGKGIVITRLLVILKPGCSKLSLMKYDFPVSILKPAALSFFEIIVTLFRWTSKLLF